MRTKGFLLIVCLVLLCVFAAGCGGNSDQSSSQEGTQVADNGSCMTCHSDQAKLEAAKNEDVEVGNYLVAESFLKSTHGGETCVSCHDGNSEAAEKKGAHTGLVVDPTTDGGQEKCGKCHSELTEKFQTSLHFTAAGLEDKLALRLSKTENGDQMAHEIFMAEDSCYSCHATCGQCHISKPTANGGGLLAGHEFIRATEQRDNDETCGFCHDTIGPQYMGKHGLENDKVAVAPDVHYAQGMSCVDCHKSSEEMHGYGKEQKNMNDEGVITTDCLTCHKDIQGKGTHTEKHLASVSCSGCHADNYWSCYGCHEGEPSEVKNVIRLGMGSDGKIDTFSHTPISATMYGEPKLDMKKLNTKSSWIQTVPHTIKAVEASDEFCNKCHTANRGGADDIFLKPDEFQFPDVEENLLVPKDKMPKPL